MTALGEEPTSAAHGVAPPEAVGPWVWSIAGLIGSILAAGGLVDFVLVWFPAHWSSPDWRFGAVAESAAALPAVVLGVALMLGGAIARGRTGMLRVVGLLLLVLSLAILGELVVFVRDAQPVLLAEREEDPVALLGVRRIVLRTEASLGLLAPGLVVAAVSALGAGFARRPPKA